MRTLVWLFYNTKFVVILIDHNLIMPAKPREMFGVKCHFVVSLFTFYFHSELTFSVWYFPLLASWVFLGIRVHKEFPLILKCPLASQTFSSTHSFGLSSFNNSHSLTHHRTRSQFTSQFNHYQEIFVKNNYCALDSLNQLPH